MTKKTKTYHARIPVPPHPSQREKKLPWQMPPEIQEKEDTQRSQEIASHPNYLIADEDTHFLAEPQNRGIRLELDYSKAESILNRAGIKETIVVFGSTRIPSPEVAKSRLSALEEKLSTNNSMLTLEQLQRQIRIARRIAEKSHYYDVARDFGKLVGASQSCNQNRQLVIMTGGGPGMMEAANRGAYDVNAPTVGLNIHLPHEQYPNPYLTPEYCLQFHYFATRKMHFLMRAKALVAFPGGYGTFDELFETLTLIQTRKMPPLPVVLVGEAFWKEAVNFEFLVNEGVIDPEDENLFWYAERPDEIWQGILEWHERNGTPLSCVNPDNHN